MPSFVSDGLSALLMTCTNRTSSQPESKMAGFFLSLSEYIGHDKCKKENCVQVLLPDLTDKVFLCQNIIQM